jgi:hypothetical protein
MDISKLKDVARKLNVFSDYSSLLLPLGIIVAAGLLFIPIQLLSSRLKAQIVSESVSVGRKIDSLSGNAVARDQWKQEEKYQRSYENDANQMSLLARQSTQRELLSYKIFPQPKDVSALVFAEFGQRFRGKINELLVRINARDCPTPAEIERSLQSSLASRTRQSDVGASTSQDAVVTAAMKDALCRARAESTSVYINPDDLSGYIFWSDYKYTGVADATKDCWFAQLAYWVIEDVIDTISAVNKGSNSVFTSPVKQLLAVSFAGASVESKTGNVKVGDRPAYVITVMDGLTESFTARLSNSDIDIVHFNVVVVVNTRTILPFMQQLCSARQHKFRGFSGNEPERTFTHNQIAILESSINSFDGESPAFGLYRYGEDAMVKLDLICEYIFYKEGYKEIKPDSIKELLKEQSGTQPSAG